MVESKISIKDLETGVDLFYRNLYQKNELNRLIEQPKGYGPSEPELYEKEDNVFEANSYLFGNNLGDGTTFGVTFVYGGKIILLDSLKGEDRSKVLEHEKHHRNNPMDSEIKTREKTSTVDFYPNPIVSPSGGMYN